MFFWIALPIVFLIFVGAVSYGVRGYDGRTQEPGTQYMNRPRRRRDGSPRA